MPGEGVILVVSALLLAGLVVAVLVTGEWSARRLLIAAISAWAFSFLASWSIGLVTLVVAFVLASLSAARALGWASRPLGGVLATACGVVLWFLSVKLVDDYWLFYPWAKLLEWVGGS